MTVWNTMVIQALWLCRIVEVSFFLLARGAKVVNVQAATVLWQGLVYLFD